MLVRKRTEAFYEALKVFVADINDQYAHEIDEDSRDVISPIRELAEKLKDEIEVIL